MNNFGPDCKGAAGDPERCHPSVNPGQYPPQAQPTYTDAAGREQPLVGEIKPGDPEFERKLDGLARAQDQVLLTAAAYRRRMAPGGGFVARGGQVSRFVDEIPAELLDREESQAITRERSRAYAGSGAASGGWGGREAHRGGGRRADTEPGPVYRTRGALARTVGREVHHETFGRGVVVMAEGEGSEIKFTVRFGSGTRKVLGRFLTGGTDVDPA